MKGLRIAACVLLVLLAAVLFLSRPRAKAPRITVRYVGGILGRTFWFTNHTAKAQWVSGKEIEVHIGSVWTNYPDLFGPPSGSFFLEPHGIYYSTLYHDTLDVEENLPTTNWWRLRVVSLQPLNSVEDFWMRIKDYRRTTGLRGRYGKSSGLFFKGPGSYL